MFYGIRTFEAEKKCTRHGSFMRSIYQARDANKQREQRTLSGSQRSAGPQHHAASRALGWADLAEFDALGLANYARLHALGWTLHANFLSHSQKDSNSTSKITVKTRKKLSHPRSTNPLDRARS